MRRMKRPTNGGESDWHREAEAMLHEVAPVAREVAAAMLRVPRHRFVPLALQEEAYRDTPLPLGFGDSTISAPHMVALQLEWAELKPGLNVLEIGSGSGYLAALVADLVGPDGHVIGIEIDPGLAAQSRNTLRSLAYSGLVTIHTTDGIEGWPPKLPYDRILVSCSTPEILPTWKEQLATPGILIAPVGRRWGQVLKRLHKTAQGERVEDGPECVFVGLSRPRPTV